MIDSLVVDANIVFSALIKKSDNFRLISILSRFGIKLYSPQFVLDEINKREDKLLKFSMLNIAELRFLIDDLFKNIRYIPKSEYESFLKEAIEIFPEHPKDAPYFALSLKLNIPLWSNEKLHKTQSKVKVFNTSEIIRFLGEFL